jgi:predicted RNase H-like HicB family nuclease
MTTFNISAHWDAEAEVWWAESADIPGFVAEAATHDDLVSEIRLLVPELLAENMPDVKIEDVRIKLVSEQTEEVSFA